MKIVNLELKILRRHPIHERLNVERTNKELVQLGESILKYGRQNPLIFQYIEIGGVLIPHVVDGWSSAVAGMNQGIETLPGIEITKCDETELPELIMEVQSGFHRDPEEDYLRFEYFIENFGKGQGYRSDLDMDLNTWVDEEE